MKIATWNVNSLKMRIDLVKEWITTNNPDFLLMQEIKGEDESIFKTFESLGYHAYYNLQKTYNGVATLSKHPCTITKKEIPNFPDTQARILEVEYDNILYINIYVPNGNPIDTPKYEYKKDWLNALFIYLQDIMRSKHFVIAGDFNIAPNDVDVYAPKLFLNDALTSTFVRDWWYKLINLGLCNVLDFKYQEQNDIYTWWDYRNAGFTQNHGLKIDYILLSPLLTDVYSDCLIDKMPRQKEKPSDHTPVVVTLKDPSSLPYKNI